MIIPCMSGHASAKALDISMDACYVVSAIVTTSCNHSLWIVPGTAEGDPQHDALKAHRQRR